MGYDISRIRALFPSLTSGIAHFDGPGGTQTPASVGAAIADCLTGPLSNRGSVVTSERRADQAVVEFRLALADLLGVPPSAIVYGRSATQLAYDFSRHLSRHWGEDDEIVVTRLDHDSNVRPWIQAAERTGATVRWADFDRGSGELTADAVAAVLTERTRLVAVTAASNLIGTIPPIAEIASLAHYVGALVYVDGVHYAAHEFVDVDALGADFFVCSPYKFLGPHCGVLAAAPDLLDSIFPDKLLPSTTTVPERFEFGTLPYELMAGTTAAVEALAGLDDSAVGSRRERLRASFAELTDHEGGLRDRLEDGLAALPGVTVHSQAKHRTPTLLVTFAGHDEADLYRELGRHGILAPAGSFYAIEASRHLGLGDRGGLRIGLAPYSSAEDVDRLLTVLPELLRAEI